MPLPHLLRPEEVASLLGVPERNLRSILPWIQLGKRTFRFNPEDIVKVWPQHRPDKDFGDALQALMEERRIGAWAPKEKMMRIGRHTLPNYRITGRIYFIEGGDLIKIGYARSPKTRLKDLQIASSIKLRLIAAMPGSYPLETHLHDRFKKLHQRGEWFRADIRLRRFIQEVARWKYKASGVEIEMTDEEPITMEELKELFGDMMPIEAAKLLWEAPDDWTIGMVRAKLREMAAAKVVPFL